MGKCKGKYTVRKCCDCGKEMLMFQSRKRCPECALKHYREYQIQYARELRAMMKGIRDGK